MSVPRNPEDAVCAPHHLAYGDDEFQEPGLTIQVAHGGSRAPMQRRYADEIGCDFADVSVLVRYIRIFTRQEVWEDHGQEDWTDRWMMREGVGYYFASMGIPTGEGHYRDDDVDEWKRTGKLPEQITVPDAPEVVPADWEPDWERGWGAYTFTDRLDTRPHVYKMWVVEA